jgi:hypothetical protein
VVKAIDGGAGLKEGRSGKTLLRIRITAEVDGVKSDYTITYGRRGAGNAAVGRAGAEADARGGGAGCGPAVGRRCVRETAARVVYGGEPLEGFRRCVGLAGAVEELLDVPASPAAGRELKNSSSF